MIAQVTGTVVQLGPTAVVIEVGGFGVLALCSPHTTAGLKTGETATLSTSLVVREDSLTLYGFAGVDERDLFELLQTATGVGPKLAQAALAVLPPDDLRSAIATENLVTLCKVPGIGRKGAQRLVIELKDKIGTTGSGTEQVASANGRQRHGSVAGWRDQVSQGLQGLGWSVRDADAACDAVESLADEPGTGVPQLMRAALQTLARR